MCPWPLQGYISQGLGACDYGVWNFNHRTLDAAREERGSEREAPRGTARCCLTTSRASSPSGVLQEAVATKAVGNAALGLPRSATDMQSRDGRILGSQEPFLPTAGTRRRYPEPRQVGGRLSMLLLRQDHPPPSHEAWLASASALQLLHSCSLSSSRAKRLSWRPEVCPPHTSSRLRWSLRE